MRKSRDLKKSHEFENGMKLILKKVPFTTYPIVRTLIGKMKLVKTLGFKDFAPNTIDIYYTLNKSAKTIY